MNDSEFLSPIVVIFRFLGFSQINASQLADFRRKNLKIRQFGNYSYSLSLRKSAPQSAKICAKKTLFQ